MEPNEEHIRKLTGNQNPEENYKVPDGYFDTFSSKVKDRIEGKQQPKKAPAFAWLLRPAYSIPAIVVVLLATGYFVFFNTPPPATQVADVPSTVTKDTTEISVEAMEEYLANDVELVGIEDDIDGDLLAYAFADYEEETVPQKPSIKPTSIDTSIELTEEEMEEYLFENAEDLLFENL